MGVVGRACFPRAAALLLSTAVAPVKKDTSASRESQLVRDLAKARCEMSVLKEDNERLRRENNNLHREMWAGSPPILLRRALPQESERLVVLARPLILSV